MNVWGIAAMSCVALLLVACERTPEQQIALCQLRAETLYAHEHADEAHMLRVGKYVEICMASKGYSYNIGNLRCPDIALFNTRLNSSCYRHN